MGSLGGLLTIAGLGLSLGLLYFIIVAIYNIYFHPLARFPGPKLAAATQLPIARVSLNGSLTHWLKELHDRYDSDVVRTGPNELSFNGPLAWKDIYAHRQGHQIFQKDLTLFAGIDGIITANDADHARVRRLLGHAFSDKALPEQEPLLQSYVATLISGLRRQVQGPSKGKVNLVDWFNWTTFDVIGDLSFGESFDCLENERYHFWVQMLFSGIQAVVFHSVIIRFPPLAHAISWCMAPHVKAALRQMEAHKQLAREKVERRLGTVTDRPDFMSYILRHDGEKGLSREEMYGNMSSIIAAGSETTGTFLAGAIWYLHLPQHRAILDKVLAEIRGAFTSADQITLANVAKCEYFLAVIEEVFRIYPPGLAGQPRLVPPGGDTVSGYFIPGGTGIQLNVFAASRSARNFASPDAFVPERWLGDVRFASDRRAALQPFSIGARNCIGKNLALAEIRLVLAHLLWAFDVEVCAETDADWTDQKAWFTWKKKPLVVRLRSRLG